MASEAGQLTEEGTTIGERSVATSDLSQADRERDEEAQRDE
ncbi:hypothetical protein [Flexivirga aerilata]|nr:hypothetical protein [Flexivirga aerilata]